MRLDEVLRRFPEIIFNVDAKSWQVMEPLVTTIRELGAQRQVALASFSETRLKRMRVALPGVRSSLGTGAIAVLVLAAHLPRIIGPALARVLVPGPRQGVEAVQVPQRKGIVRVITPEFVRLCHARGLAVHAWTINREADMRALLEMRIDGIITDRPTLAQRVIDDFWVGR